MMMEENTFPIILGLHLYVLLMLVSGIFYLVCAFYVWKSLRREKNDLLSALFAFLVYQAISMFFMGVEMQTMNMAYGRVAALSILIGSAYMLKFPFSRFSSWTRRIVFMFSMIMALSIFAWFIQTPEKEMALMHFVLWYDIIVNGIVVGGTMILFGLRTTERVFKMKALGGGSGVVSCCVVANATMLSGAMLTSSAFQFLAPILILGSLLFVRKNRA